MYPEIVNEFSQLSVTVSVNDHTIMFSSRKRKKDKGRPISNEVAPDPEPEKDPAKEAEILLTARFKAFDHGLKEIEKICDRWERTIGKWRVGILS